MLQRTCNVPKLQVVHGNKKQAFGCRKGRHEPKKKKKKKKKKHDELNTTTMLRVDNVPQYYRGTATYLNSQESVATKSSLLGAERVAMNQKQPC